MTLTSLGSFLLPRAGHLELEICCRNGAHSEHILIELRLEMNGDCKSSAQLSGGSIIRVEEAAGPTLGCRPKWVGVMQQTCATQEMSSNSLAILQQLTLVNFFSSRPHLRPLSHFMTTTCMNSSISTGKQCLLTNEATRGREALPA